MGNIFGEEKPLKEIIKENQRTIRKSIRELDKEIYNMQNNEKKLIADIKKSAKSGQMGPVKTYAKDLVRTRSYITRFIEMKTQLNAVSLKLQTVKSNEAMSNALKGVTKALISMNKKTSIAGLQKIVAEFSRENEKAELTQEAIADSIDDAMMEDESEAEESAVVNQVLDELGIEVGSQVPTVPMGQPTQENQKIEVDPGMEDLEKRLNNLRK